MTQEKPSSAVKFQFILFGALLLIFFIWAGGKCSRSQDGIEAERMANIEAQMIKDSLELQAAANLKKQQAAAAAKANDPVNRDTIRGGQMQIIRERTNPLFVTIEGLALREGPGLNKKIITRLKLYEEVSFMNEVTDSLYSIKLGNITPNEPWVKVRSRKGQTGWVYGAGVDFYKRKIEGVE